MSLRTDVSVISTILDAQIRRLREHARNPDNPARQLDLTSAIALASCRMMLEAALREPPPQAASTGLH